MFITAVITAITVSIDGFFAGVAEGIKNTKIPYNKLFVISIIPIIMAIPVMLLGNYVSELISSNIANYIGAGLFMFLAVSSFMQIKKTHKDNNVYEYNDINLLNGIVIGFTIGIDSSISAFSLALAHHNPFITPFYFGISHGVLIWLGNNIALNKKVFNVEYSRYLSPFIFTIIAFIKLL